MSSDLSRVKLFQCSILLCCVVSKEPGWVGAGGLGSGGPRGSKQWGACHPECEHILCRVKGDPEVTEQNTACGNMCTALRGAHTIPEEAWGPIPSTFAACLNASACPSRTSHANFRPHCFVPFGERDKWLHLVDEGDPHLGQNSAP